MGSLHLAVSVFALIWKTLRLLKLKKIVSLSRDRTLSGHTWVTARKFSILNLSSLHPSSKPYLGKPRLGRTVKLVGYGLQLLGDSLGWSDYEFDCSALFTPAGTSSKWRCTVDTRRSGTSYGGYDPGYPWQTTWTAPPRVVQLTRRRFTVHGTARHVPQDIKGDILKMLRDLLGYV